MQYISITKLATEPCNNMCKSISYTSCFRRLFSPQENSYFFFDMLVYSLEKAILAVLIALGWIATNDAHQNPISRESFSLSLFLSVLSAWHYAQISALIYTLKYFGFMFIKSTLKALVGQRNDWQGAHLWVLARTHTHTHTTHTHTTHHTPHHTLAKDQRDICWTICDKPSIKMILVSSCRKANDSGSP